MHSAESLLLKKIYKSIGGGSPILKEIQKQTSALNKSLGKNFKVFISMRYWHPFVEDILPEINSGDFDEVILLPLYLQFSTTTTLSFVESCFKKIKPNKKVICCYYDHPLFIQSYTRTIYKGCKYSKTNIANKKVICCYYDHPLFIQSYADLAL